LGDAFIFEPRQDPLLWLLIASGLPQAFIESSFLAWTYDIIILLLPVVLYFSQIKDKHKYSWLLFLAYSLYLLIIFSYPSLSIRKYLGLALVMLLFSARTKVQYVHIGKALRYFLCFIFVSASLWKLSRGTLLDSSQFVNILSAQHAQNFILFPDHISTLISQYLISKPGLAYIFYVLVALLQFSFLIGFFTKNYDKWLAMGLLAFILGDYLIMRIEYWEFIVFLPLVLLPNAEIKND